MDALLIAYKHSQVYGSCHLGDALQMDSVFLFIGDLYGGQTLSMSYLVCLQRLCVKVQISPVWLQVAW